MVSHLMPKMQPDLWLCIQIILSKPHMKHLQLTEKNLCVITIFLILQNQLSKGLILSFKQHLSRFQSYTTCYCSFKQKDLCCSLKSSSLFYHKHMQKKKKAEKPPQFMLLCFVLIITSFCMLEFIIVHLSSFLGLTWVITLESSHCGFRIRWGSIFDRSPLVTIKSSCF